MGNKNEGYLGGIMGGASRVGSISLDGNKLAGTSILDWTDAGSSYGSSTSTAMVKTGDSWDLLSYDISGFTDGFVCIEMFLPADTAHRAGGIGYSNGATLSSVVGSAVGAAGIRRQIGASVIGQVSTAGFSTTNSTFHNYGAHPVVFQLLIECSTGNAWLSYGEAGGATRYWVTGQITRSTSFDYNSPLDASTVITELHAQNYYGGTTSYVNLGADGTFGGQTSDNDTSEWFWDIPAEIKGSGGSVTGLKNTGILSLEEAGTQVVGGPVDSNTQSVITTDFTDANSGYTMTSDTRVTKSGSIWDYLKYDISSFSSGYIYAEMLVSAANSSYMAFGVGDGTAPSNVYGGTTAQASIRSRSNNELNINTFTLAATTSSQISSAFTSYPLVFSLLIDCATKDVWIAFSSEDGSDRKWLTGATTTTSTFDINTPFVSGFTGLSEIGVQTQTNGQYADINFGTDGTFGGATSSNESASWFFDPPAEVAGSVSKTLPQLSWGGITGRSVLTDAPLAVDTFATLDDTYTSHVVDPANNLTVDFAADTSHVVSTQSVSSGKYYAEFRYDAFDTGNAGFIMASVLNGLNPNSYDVAYYGYNGNVYIPGNSSSPFVYGDTVTNVGDIIGVALDADNGIVWFSKNGTWIDGSGNGATSAEVAAEIAAGTTTNAANPNNALTGPLWLGFGSGSSLDRGSEGTANFGQDATFNGTESAGAYTDANGLGEFYYEPPAGFVGLYTTTGGSAGTPGDDDWNDVTLLLDGENATIADVSSASTALTVGSSVSQNTSTVKYGSGSLRFTHTTDSDANTHVSYTGPTLSGDYTVELWFRPDSSLGATTAEMLWECRAGASTYPLLWVYYDGTAGAPIVELYAETGVRIQSTTTLTANTWYHVALVRSSGTYTMYIDGVSQGTWANSSTIDETTQYIGRRFEAYDSNYYGLNGYLDDFRLTPGVARYTSNFTPPTESFPTSLLGTPATQSLVNTGIFTLEEIYELTKALPPVDFATGGTVSDINVSGQDYRVHLFTTSGTFTVNTALTDVEYLVIGGGGGGGRGSGGPGGGGAGGYLEGTIASLSIGDQTITVGAGGAGASSGSDGGANGGDSSIGSLVIADGGGYGAGRTVGYGGAGGSGGGAADYLNPSTANPSGGTATSGQGYNGGNGVYSGATFGGGGGGGAGAAGANGSTVGGVGGAGKASSITGTSVTRAGGGGGTGTGGASTSGGSGGGGASAVLNDTNPGSNGAANTGSGGGGGTLNAAGGSGGSGVVIIRYKI
jgi:hypothetical protein